LVSYTHILAILRECYSLFEVMSICVRQGFTWPSPTASGPCLLARHRKTSSGNEVATWHFAWPISDHH